jgi:hypothetical protein
MMRSLSLATVLAAAITLPAYAQDTPAKAPVAPSATTAPATGVPAAGVTTAPKAAGMMLTAQEALAWVDKPVYSSDGKKLGEVVAFLRSADNTVNEMHADIGGFLGIGETRVKVTPAQFKLQTDRVVLDVTAAQAKDLPKITK